MYWTRLETTLASDEVDAQELAVEMEARLDEELAAEVHPSGLLASGSRLAIPHMAAEGSAAFHKLNVAPLASICV